MKVGFVGWRGMVGSVLMQRMQEEGDFNGIEATFYTTSQAGQSAPTYDGAFAPSELVDAHDLESLCQMDAVISCQGGGYTTSVHEKLRDAGYKGYWIDAASTLRMESFSTIVLDPVNRAHIDRQLAEGCRDFVGGNCTVSLMLMGLGGLFAKDLVEWASAHTYQAASGAGAANMKELVAQMGYLHDSVADMLADRPVLEVDSALAKAARSDLMPTEKFSAPLAGSLLPYIDTEVAGGRSREEWKAQVETQKILNADVLTPIDGTCVRIGAMRCHSQAITLKLKKVLPLAEIESIIADANPWVDFVENSREATLAKLSPTTYTGSLNIGVGRVRKMTLGDDFLNVFTVGDQLLWGAAEPLRRMLAIIRGQI